MTMKGTLDKKIHQLSLGDPNQIIQKLNTYGTESHEGEPERVRLAILKLCGEDLHGLDDLIEAAKRDYRDVLAWAEYPEEIRAGYRATSELSPEELAALRKRDREQYVKWLEQ